jgi:hypothetical protein
VPTTGCIAIFDESVQPDVFPWAAQNGHFNKIRAYGMAIFAKMPGLTGHSFNISGSSKSVKFNLRWIFVMRCGVSPHIPPPCGPVKPKRMRGNGGRCNCIKKLL